MLAYFNAGPSIVIVVIHSKAAIVDLGPDSMGTVPGVPEVFERGPDESLEDFPKAG
jgi:hypothetical protein